MVWPTSERWNRALGKPHDVATVVTFAPPGGSAVELSLKAGSVSGDSQSNYRRTGSLSLFGNRADFEMLTLPGGVVHIDHGINFGSTTELVPVFHGEIVDGSQQLGDGSISVRVADLGKWLERARFLTPFTPTAGTQRKSVIATAVIDARPGTTVTVTATDAGVVQSGTWQDSRLDMIKDLRTDGAMEAFFLPDGTYLIRDQLTMSSPPVWSITPGQTGVLKSVSRRRPMDKTYNTVVVRPSSSDGSQTWVQQVAQVTAVNHPRHPSKIGVVPYFWSSPTTTTAGAALTAAYNILDRVLGTTETLELGLLSNAALEPGDPIRVVTPQVGLEPADIYQHYVDSFSLDLRSGDMSIATRSQVTDA